MLAPDRFLSMGEIEQCVQKKSDVKLQYLKQFNCLPKRAQAHLRMLSTKYI